MNVSQTAFCASPYAHRFFNDRWYRESETIGQSVCCKQYGCVGINGFYQFLSSGIKPIIGADVHVKSELCGEELFTLTLLAKNNEGYKNITLLLSKAYQRGYVDLPYIDQEWLIEHREGVIVLSGGAQGDIAKKLLKENISEAESAVSF